MMKDRSHIDKAFHSKNRFIMNNFRYHIDYTVKQTKDFNGKIYKLSMSLSGRQKSTTEKFINSTITYKKAYGTH